MRKQIMVMGLAAGLGLSLGVSSASAQIARRARGNALDQQIQSQLQQKFSGEKKLVNVHPTVEDRIVTLNGTVPDYRAKMEAEHQARGFDNVNGFVDNLSVTGASVSDQQLEKTLADKLTYDRMGMGQAFNALTVKVHNGVATVGGNVRDYPDRDSALALVEDTAGVRGVNDQIKVAPLSPMDDQIRLEAARAIYGNPSLLPYANDPAHTIRIVVNNGHVILAGVVNSQVDKAVAGNAVRSIPGVFSVQNDLVVSH
ncbi:MAG TPA: BON domain-containing protein [Terriglobales bacterium]|nr:BON domain-containing protein [Terriglobales bacterium]